MIHVMIHAGIHGITLVHAAPPYRSGIEFVFLTAVR